MRQIIPLSDRLFACLGNHDTEHPYFSDRHHIIAAAVAFRRFSAARPYFNQCTVARDIAARHFNISSDQLLVRSRESDLMVTRQKIMAFVHVMTGASFSQIGRYFNRDHSAVSYACDKYANAIRKAVSEISE